MKREGQTQANITVVITPAVKSEIWLPGLPAQHPLRMPHPRYPRCANVDVKHLPL